MENSKRLKNFNSYLGERSLQGHQKAFQIFLIISVPGIAGRPDKRPLWLAPTLSFPKNFSSPFYVPGLRSGHLGSGPSANPTALLNCFLPLWTKAGTEGP